MVQKGVRVEGKERETEPGMGKEGWAVGLLPVKGTVWRLRSLSELVAGAITMY